MQVAAGCRKRACDAVPFSGTIMHYQNVGSGLMIGLGNRYCGFFHGSSGRKNLSTAFGQIMRDEHWARLRLLSTFFQGPAHGRVGNWPHAKYWYVEKPPT